MSDEQTSPIPSAATQAFGRGTVLSAQAGPQPPASTPRRDFLKTAGVAGLALAAGMPARAQASSDAAPPADSGGNGGIPLRPLGRAKDVKISALGLGGHHLGDMPDVESATRVVHEAIDGGITFFDNCWEYHNGKSENWLGRALAGRRDKVFLMTKVCTHGRGAPVAMEMLEQSLLRLKTDHLDLWQIHGVTFDNDPDLAYASGGVLEALDLAKKQGKVRFVGFTGHKDPAIHLRMVKRGYPFDSVQMPLNPFDSNFLSFEKVVLPELHNRGIAALGMKPMNGNAMAIKGGLVTAAEMLRYAMSLPVATTIAGIDSPEVLRQNLALAQDFQPMSAGDMQALRDKCATLAADGRFELYKVSLAYDNPQARIVHHFPIDQAQKEVKDMLESNLTASPI
jgi:aryl-alcohol dehydrogenase-like predicted oxidoreductase